MNKLYVWIQNFFAYISVRKDNKSIFNRFLSH